MLIQMGNANQVEATADVRKQMQAHARSFSTSDVLRMMKAFNTAATDFRGGWQPSLSLELALAEVLDAPPKSVRKSLRRLMRSLSRLPLHKRNSGTSNFRAERKVETCGERAIIPESSTLNPGDVIKAWKHLSSSLPKAQANLSALLNSVRMIERTGQDAHFGFGERCAGLKD